MPRGEQERRDADAAAAHCPNCNAEYRAGFTHCADCGVELEPGPARSGPGDAWAAANERVWGSQAPPRRPRPDDHEPPIPIAELPWEEAWLLVGRLRSAGIETFIYPPEPASRNAYGTALEFGSRHVHQVLVYRADVEDARAIAVEEAPA
ncbi:MAG TPA: hypothetical protein VKA30_05585 [Actinomycetota bacterium]|nr:hypothetical protein [Actinomycetota bacterium]